MSTIVAEVLNSNAAYAQSFGAKAGLALPPARRFAILTCMDARLDPAKYAGLSEGDAHVIRNAGGLASEDALRSLIISHHLLGTQEFMIINHTDCGMLTFKDDELRERLEKETGTVSDVPASFHAFSDVEANVRRQVETVRSHPWIPKGIPVRGFIFDVKTGKLNEVSVGRQSAASKP